jgi:hypothetical protein
MIKTSVMLLGLVAVVGLGTACSGLFSRSEKEGIEASCEGLEGQAKIDCEKRKQP